MGMMLRYHREEGAKTPSPKKTEPIEEVKETPKKIKKEGKKNDFGRKD